MQNGLLQGSMGEPRARWLRHRKLKVSLANADSSEKAEMRKSMNREPEYIWESTEKIVRKELGHSHGRRNWEPENDFVYFNNWEGKGTCAHIKRESAGKRYSLRRWKQGVSIILRTIGEFSSLFGGDTL